MWILVVWTIEVKVLRFTNRKIILSTIQSVGCKWVQLVENLGIIAYQFTLISLRFGSPCKVGHYIFCHLHRSTNEENHIIQQISSSP